MEKPISANQLKRLQVLYSQLARHTDQDAGREARLRWASALLDRPIASFKDLSRDDARRLIDTLQGQLGVKAAPAQRLSREAAHRAGTEGRRNNPYKTAPQMVSAADLAVIEDYYSRLGWTRAQFDAWLASSRSPIKRANPVIATLADANAVRWALKGMLKHRGLWQERVA
jgi:hypothetical protein